MTIKKEGRDAANVASPGLPTSTHIKLLQQRLKSKAILIIPHWRLCAVVKSDL